MICLAFDFCGLSTLIEVYGKLNAKSYVSMLDEHLRYEAKRCVPKTFIFQQDNAPGHSAAYTRKWLEANKIAVLPWPPSLPACNPVENLWHIIQQSLYDERRTFKSVTEFREAIHRAISKIKK